MARVLLAGVQEHGIVDAEMRRLQKLRIATEIEDTIIFLEHPEVVTIGPRARKEGTTPPADYPTTSVDRGGGLTWHGPGQLVCYPVVEWKREGEANVARIINILETWIIAAFEKLGIEGRRDERMQGVWVGTHKVASIGLSFRHWISRHGFTINYDTPLGRVEGLSGCGLGSEVTTCLSRVGHAGLSREDIVRALVDTLEEATGREPGMSVEVKAPPW